ncbi:MAG: YidC/Oxa1 family membrane protein insertase, partial [Clostridiales bacterium]|nr:YidC/Oxa1 family membrane protein insertase [Clostridiales bacterium]
MFTILTKSGGILGPIASLFGLIMNGIYNFFSLFGIHNIALTIIIFTFITRALMLPLTIRQQKFSKLSSKMNPELQKIQAKYKGKKDEASLRKMQAENAAVYQKYGVSPVAGCLPLLITLPIMFALIQVIYNIPAYVDQVYDLYAGIASRIQEVNGFETSLNELANSIKGLAVPEVYTERTIIDVLKKFNSSNWEAFRTSFASILNASAITLKGGQSLTVAGTIGEIQRINGFFGLNIADNPGFNFPAILIPILAGLLQFIQGKQLQVKNQDNKDNPTASAVNSMNVVMPLMSVF